MADFKSKLSGLFSNAKKAAEDVLESQQIALSRGRTASKDVLSDSGEIIVEAGHRIDEETIQKAKSAGKLSALAGAAVTSSAQDFRERARNTYDSTPDGIEARSMASSEQYIEARRYIGRIASVDVTDIRGNMIIQAGQKLDDSHVRAAREADQLGSLIYSAQQSPAVNYASPPPPPVAAAPSAPSSSRAARPLTSYYDEDEA